MAKKIIKWFAKGGGIARCGPYDTQVQAINAMRLVKRPAQTRIASDFTKGHAKVWLVRDEQRKEFPDDVFVWPEEVRT